MFLRVQLVTSGEDITVTLDENEKNMYIVPVLMHADLKVRIVERGGEYRARFVLHTPLNVCCMRGGIAGFGVFSRF